MPSVAVDVSKGTSSTQRFSPTAASSQFSMSHYYASAVAVGTDACHTLFSMIVNSPRLSDELTNPVWKGGSGRFKPLDLDNLVYSEGTTFKLHIVMAAIREAGADMPRELSGLAAIAGSFRCQDCASNGGRYHSRMSWDRAARHVMETTEEEEYQEDGEWQAKPRLHLRLQYNPDVPVAVPNFNDDDD